MRLKDKTALAFAREGAAVMVADVDETGGEKTAALIRKERLAATFVPPCARRKWRRQRCSLLR